MSNFLNINNGLLKENPEKYYWKIPNPLPDNSVNVTFELQNASWNLLIMFYDDLDICVSGKSVDYIFTGFPSHLYDVETAIVGDDEKEIASAKAKLSSATLSSTFVTRRLISRSDLQAISLENKDLRLCIRIRRKSNQELKADTKLTDFRFKLQELESQNISKNGWKHLRNFFKEVSKAEKTAASATISAVNSPLKGELSFISDSPSSNDSDIDESEDESDQKKGKKRKRNFLGKGKDELLCKYLRREIQDKRKKNDDPLRCFFSSIECSVRAMNEETKQEAKEKIQEVIFKMEREKIEGRKRERRNMRVPARRNIPQSVSHIPPIYTTYESQNIFRF